MNSILPSSNKNFRRISFLLLSLFVMSSFAFAQNATNGGEIAANQSICPGETPALFINVESASGGDDNLQLQYLWMMGNTANFPVGFVAAPGDNDDPTYQAPPLGTNTFFIRCARRAGYTEFLAESNIISVEVLQSPTAIVNNAPTGSIYQLGQVTLTAVFTPGAYYRWDMNGDGIPECQGIGVTSCTSTYINVGTYNATLTVINPNQCSATTTVPIQVVQPVGLNSNTACNCADPLIYYTPTAVFIHDYVLINSNPGETWTLAGTTGGLYDASGNLLPNGTVIPESGNPGVYYLDVWYIDGIGYSANYNNGISFFNLSQFDNCNCANPLPVELIDFDATVVGTNVELKWATRSETNNSHFELERSTDGNRFEMITEVEGNGNTTDFHIYSYMDKDAEEGSNYYRLKQVDLDGTYEYFTVVSAVINDEKPVLQILPNPVKDIASIRLEKNISLNAQFELFNSTGQLIRTIDITSNESTLEINMENMESGIYFLHLVNHSNEQSERIIRKVIKQ